MRVICVSVCVLAFILSACHKEKESETAPVFEIREVGCNESITDAMWSYTCQGTLLTRDIRYSNKQLVIWLEDVSTHHNGERLSESPYQTYVLMSNGVATLRAGGFYSKKRVMFGVTTGDYDSDPGEPHPAWRILGFSILEPAQAVVETAK